MSAPQPAAFALKCVENTSLSNTAHTTATAPAGTPPDYIKDAQSLSKTELNEKYRLTYDAHRSMLGSHGKRGIFLEERLRDFRVFLAVVGPKLSQSQSLDRIDNSKGYEADNLRWASKSTQSRNRRNVITLFYKGTTRCLIEWAEITKQSPNVMRSHHRLGWSDAEVIEGRRSSTATGTIWDWTPWPEENRLAWERAFQLHGWHGRREYRAQFFLRFAEKKLGELWEEFDWHEEFSPDDAPAEWRKQFAFWTSNVSQAKSKLREAIGNRKLKIAKHPPESVEKQLALAARPQKRKR